MQKRTKHILFGGVLVGFVAIHSVQFFARFPTTGTEINGTKVYFLGDDALISMRYAYNLINGNGFVWNPGERVQGFTNLGWALIMGAVLSFASLEFAPAVIIIINYGIAIILFLVVISQCFRHYGAVSAIFAGILLVCNIPILFWELFGFENILQALLITLALLHVFERNLGPNSPLTYNFWLSPFFSGLAFVVRPDSLLLAGFVFFIFALKSLLSGIWKTRRFFLSILFGLIPIILVFLFQYFYYGDLFPNTYYLKSTAGSGGFLQGYFYVIDIIFGHNFYFAFIFLMAGGVFSVFLFKQGLERYSFFLLFIPVVFLVWVGYVMTIGGDPFSEGRFFVVITPLLCFGSAIAARIIVLQSFASFKIIFLPEGGQSRLRGILILIPQFFILISGMLVSLRYIKNGLEGAGGGFDPVHVDSYLMARKLKELNWPHDGVIAVFYAGSLPYFAPELKFHDLLGKSDRHIARSNAKPGPPGHDKWDFSYTLKGIVPMGIWINSLEERSFEWHKNRVDSRDSHYYSSELLLNPEFNRNYKQALLAPPDTSDRSRMFVHSIMLSQLEEKEIERKYQPMIYESSVAPELIDPNKPDCKALKRFFVTLGTFPKDIPFINYQMKLCDPSLGR